MTDSERVNATWREHFPESPGMQREVLHRARRLGARVRVSRDGPFVVENSSSADIMERVIREMAARYGAS